MAHGQVTVFPQPWTVQARGLTKAYGYQWALRGIDLELRRGSSLALFGPNGSGKTTLIKVLVTLARPTGGEALIEGHDIRRDAQAVRRAVGVVGHEPWLYEDLTVQENLHFYGRMYGVSDLPRRALAVLEQVGMDPYAQFPVRSLSHGMRRRVALARAFLHRPRVLLLDEPEAGLDQEALALLERALAQARMDGMSVLIATHDLAWGLALAERAVVLHRGRIAYDSGGTRLDAAALAATYRRVTEAAP
ncbi:MAG: heme ABC exporter ATP-binding protein CcmA [Chloroflexi bacterium]|nr:heme ABC exporter ATP-binding protein CcmA [Chloroflexota bacterium]